MLITFIQQPTHCMLYNFLYKMYPTSSVGMNLLSINAFSSKIPRNPAVF